MAIVVPWPSCIVDPGGTRIVIGGGITTLPLKPTPDPVAISALYGSVSVRLGFVPSAHSTAAPATANSEIENPTISFFGDIV